MAYCSRRTRFAVAQSAQQCDPALKTAQGSGNLGLLRAQMGENGFGVGAMRGKQDKFAFGFGLLFSVAIGLSSQALAQYNGPSTFGRYQGPYLPDGPNVPTITPTLGNEGAAGLPPDKPPPPNGFDQQSMWNMRVVGFNDNQGRVSSDDAGSNTRSTNRTATDTSLIVIASSDASGIRNHEFRHQPQ